MEFYSQKWIFLPGMRFREKQKWWKPEDRKTPHEGIDFCFYFEDKKIKKIDEKTEIPSLTDGKVINIFQDLLGKTIIIQNQDKIYIYSHINPKANINQIIKQNQIIGTPSKSENPPTHLHLSIAQMPEDYPVEKLNWKTIDQDKGIVLLNPTNLIKHLTN